MWKDLLSVSASEFWVPGKYMGLECNVVFEAPVPQSDGFCKEGRRVGANLLVDINRCCNVVGEQLNVVGPNEGKEGSAHEMDCSQPQDVHM